MLISQKATHNSPENITNDAKEGIEEDDWSGVILYVFIILEQQNKFYVSQPQ